MRRHLNIVLAAAIIIGVLIGLSALGFVKFDRQSESELSPQRSSYNSGSTGVRAFYQLLEESGARVDRWREGFQELEKKASGAVLVIVGPFSVEHQPSSEEMHALQQWVMSGGNLLVVSRDSRREFTDPGLAIVSNAKEEDWTKPADEIVDSASDQLIVQPTRLTRAIKGFQLSKLASRMKIEPAASTAITTPAPSPSPESTEEETDNLSAPVVHLGDRDGAVLADFEYGDGRIAILSDPFVIANNGIGRGANLTLALNLIDDLAGTERRIMFDEAHHGFRHVRNPLFSYFRGTPAPWVVGQGVLLAMLIAYTYGRRFARPLPLPQVDRHSPLEFVGSMANLQKAAAARDLALENIYPRFRANLCRTLGLTIRTGADEVAAAFERRQAKLPGKIDVSASELSSLLRECDGVLAGAPIEDRELVAIVAKIRRVEDGLKS